MDHYSNSLLEHQQPSVLGSTRESNESIRDNLTHVVMSIRGVRVVYARPRPT
jgi:hypothetical protein